MTKPVRTSKTVRKALAILDLLATQVLQSGISLPDVQRELGIPKATAHRLLTTLESEGFVRREPQTRLYRLGAKVAELGGAFLAGLDVRREAAELLKRLMEETGETVHLGVPAGNEVVYVDKIDSPQSIRMASRIGARNPMHCTGLGKAILAQMTDREFAEVIGGGLPKRTPNTITSAAELGEELERVRAQGFALDNVENEAGVRCAGAPVFDSNGRVIAAISVSGPATRITLDRIPELAELIKGTAAQISRRMGYPG